MYVLVLWVQELIAGQVCVLGTTGHYCGVVKVSSLVSFRVLAHAERESAALVRLPSGILQAPHFRMGIFRRPQRLLRFQGGKPECMFPTAICIRARCADPEPTGLF